MADENLNPLEELKRLDQQVGFVNDLAGLKPIFYRLDEIAKAHPNDFEVQLVVGDIKQHLVNRGTKLKEGDTGQRAPVAPSAPPISPVAAPPLPPRTEIQIPSVSKIVTPPVIPPAGPPPVPPQAPPPLVPPAVKPAWDTTSTAISPVPSREFAPGELSPPGPPPISGGPPPIGGFSTTEQPPSVPPGFKPPSQAGPPPPPMIPPQVVPPPQPPPSSGGKGGLIAGAILGLLIAGGGLGFLWWRKHVVKPVEPPTVAGLQVQVATTPPGAAIKVNGEDKCTSPCAVSLTPGDYQVTALLPGYEPGANGITVAQGAANSVNLTLEPSPQSVHIIAEGLDGGDVTVDDQPAGKVQEGQFVIDNVKPGPHTVKISGKGGEAGFAFESEAAKPPSITGTVTAKNYLVVLVSTFGSAAHVVTSSGPIKLQVNGQPQADASPTGVDLQGFQPGAAEFTLGEGAAEKKMQDTFGPAPGLTAFLKADKPVFDTGNLIVVTGEDDVRVFVNNKEQKRHTARGQLRVPLAPGTVSVRVIKDGFQMLPPQNATIQKGGDARVEFKMQKIEVAAAPKPVAPPPPGPANGGNGTIHITRTPGGATITYRRDNEAQAHELRGNQIDLPAGGYMFTARALGYGDRAEHVQISAGENKNVDLTLSAVHVAPPPPKTGTMADFEDPSAWTKDGDAWVHKGGNFVPYKLPAKGIFTFTVQLLKGGNVFRSGHIRWCVDYRDGKNYGQFEIDKKTFWAKEVVNGKTREREKTQHGLENQKAFTIQIEVTPEHVVHRVKNGDGWTVVDSWTEPGRNFSDGKFGFLIPGNDEIAITDFRFTPR